MVYLISIVTPLPGELNFNEEWETRERYVESKMRDRVQDEILELKKTIMQLQGDQLSRFNSNQDEIQKQLLKQKTEFDEKAKKKEQQWKAKHEQLWHKCEGEFEKEWLRRESQQNEELLAPKWAYSPKTFMNSPKTFMKADFRKTLVSN